MGSEHSILQQNGYVLQKETGNAVVATKGDDTFYIKKITLNQMPINSDSALISEIEIFKTTSHPHIVSGKNSFQAKDKKSYYIVMDYCQGGSLAAKIEQMSGSPSEFQVLSWIAEICMALRTIHEKDLVHNHLKPENVLLTEHGMVCLGEFGRIYENSKNTNAAKQLGKINYLPPEAFTNGTYDAKGDIWSVGCILYELCTGKSAFSAETAINLIPKIIRGPNPSLAEPFSPELCKLLDDILKKDPESRPTASEILECPIVTRCLSEKCKATVEELQSSLKKLRDVADGLERVHHGTTIGSLTGGVIGAVGGITSIVGLILTPFTLGASLIVTGVGVGVAAAGGVTAGASNITNIVNQSSDRKAVLSIVKWIEQKVNVVLSWVEVISNNVQTKRSRYDSTGMNAKFDENKLSKIGSSAGKGLSGISELVRLGRVMSIGKTAAQASRVVRVAEIATSVFSALFLAVDIFFIAMDAKEIHHIRQAQAPSETSDSDQGTGSEVQEQSSPNSQTAIRSEIMKFAQSIRKEADKLQKVLDGLNSLVLSLEDEGEWEWENMGSM